ncbi:MAG: cobalamin B12-binding domain-containing protein [Planctomycetota bacterium]|nr:MAG: cobalamin B12-binding domain-containing protein [Planctomycetota bacterium]
MKGKILLAKPGLDGHDRGILVIANALKDAGYEVIYSGIRRTPEEIVKMAIEEDVEVVGLSNLSGAHIPLFPEIARLLREKGGEDILLICGGTIPKEDFQVLKEAGFQGVFPTGTPLREILEFLEKHLTTQ